MSKLLLIPGPTNLSENVRRVMSFPQVSHTGREFYEYFLETLELSRYAFQNTKGYQFVFTGTGTTGMETSVYSLLGHEDEVLVISTGYFGKRFSIICQAHKIKYKELSYPAGMHAQPEDLRKELSVRKYKAVFITHVETSTGVKNPIDELVEECNKAGAMSVVDSVCGIGGEKLLFDDLNADIVFTASQKAIAGPPGAVMIAVSNDAMQYIEKRQDDIESYYMNLARWKPIMDDPRIYLATPATQVLIALREALLELKREGIEKRWERHERLSKIAHQYLEEAGISIVANEESRANTVTAAWLKNDNASEVQKEIEERYGIIVARGIGEFKDKMIRIGHMGNLDESLFKESMAKVVEVILKPAIKL